jgi:hypothetical protein
MNIVKKHSPSPSPKEIPSFVSSCEIRITTMHERDNKTNKDLEQCKVVIRKAQEEKNFREREDPESRF